MALFGRKSKDSFEEIDIKNDTTYVSVHLF